MAVTCKVRRHEDRRRKFFQHHISSINKSEVAKSGERAFLSFADTLLPGRQEALLPYLLPKRLRPDWLTYAQRRRPQR